MDDLLALLPADLDRLAESATRYQSAQPFPHVSFENFLPSAVAEAASLAFPSSEADIWRRFEVQGLQYLKLACDDETKIPPAIRNILYALNSAKFISFLEKLTGITHLVPDPYFHGGGLHQTMPGGQLDVHVDFNLHPELRLYRRLNLLIYLNHDWQESYGGQFELRATKTSSAVMSLVPSFNRAALFSTSKRSWHGHPRPVACPPGMSRRSLALYYYTALPADVDDVDPRSTIFAGDGMAIWRRILPPAMLDALRALRRP